jgi:hypothetical protein
MDTSGGSSTLQCINCKLCSLEIWQPEFALSISLRDFHLKRGDGPDQRPLCDLSMASELVECLRTLNRPSLATLVDFGIDHSLHYAALRKAVLAGVSAYDLDRVLGDGPAITALVNGALGRKHAQVQYQTAYDDMPSEPNW